jgi:hypothetical protein
MSRSAAGLIVEYLARASCRQSGGTNNRWSSNVLAPRPAAVDGRSAYWEALQRHPVLRSALIERMETTDALGCWTAGDDRLAGLLIRRRGLSLISQRSQVQILSLLTRKAVDIRAPVHWHWSP